MRSCAAVDISVSFYTLGPQLLSYYYHLSIIAERPPAELMTQPYLPGHYWSLQWPFGVIGDASEATGGTISPFGLVLSSIVTLCQ